MRLFRTKIFNKNSIIKIEFFYWIENGFVKNIKLKPIVTAFLHVVTVTAFSAPKNNFIQIIFNKLSKVIKNKPNCLTR